MDTLLGEARKPEPETEPLADGAVLFRGGARAEAPALFAAVQAIAEAAPFRHMTTPGGFVMSIAITNCGDFGWTSDRRGYRYAPCDPGTGKPWPAMPPFFRALAVGAAARAGFPGFAPDSCLINRYEPGARLSLHQDKDEKRLAAPIVSVSLGLPARFLFGGLTRQEKPRRFRLENGDVVVWGGPARMAFHGVDPLAGGNHPLTGRCRVNLTFRQAS
ncbi:DNA oxidative demethylase AlkB [Verrucomicrobium sp. GAS474]|uniref:DNA oxidative demethylase AlkB n=1 Tax=Verrucomicrobium sp. GAS474 TaxID=1882831 RepID=UPI000B859EB9